MGREIGMGDGGRAVEQLANMFHEGAVFTGAHEFLVEVYGVPV